MWLVFNPCNSPFIQPPFSLLPEEGPVGESVKGHAEFSLINRDSNFVIKCCQASESKLNIPDNLLVL